MWAAPLTAVAYQAVVPQGELDRTAAALARLPELRFCSSVTGACNLLFAVWMRDTGDINTPEALLDESFPALRVRDRIVTLHTAKRLGRILDSHGRAVEHVPVELPPADTLFLQYQQVGGAYSTHSS
ncbi:hypothetical protein ABZ656_46215 [Streptomyces sp. NPDC007095]|uniref:hypothetical protein n=1 Tax=Streptomyces sp. NPDC007095 TaxID=3154482 RepID=UPI0033CFB52D